VSAWSRTATGIVLRVRLTPRGGRDRIDGLAQMSDGAVLKVRVASPPVDGAANAALIGLVAKGFGVAKSRVGLVSGETARLKTLLIEGDPEVLCARADALTGG